MWLDADSALRHVDRLQAAALALCGNRPDADDLVQEIYLSLLRRPRRLTGGSQLAYLHTMLRITAKKIESYYDGLFMTLSNAKTPASKRSDTSKSGDTKSATASQANPEQRQSTATRTISNKAAGRAPATPPKQQQPAKPGVAPMKFKSKKERDDYFINKHFPK